MSSLRFLRPDDLPLLARALRELAPPHEAAHHHDVATLRQWMNVHGVRPGNCMVLWEKDELHGVLLSARRQTLDGEVQGLVQEIFIHPAHRRRGHGAEMLADLQKKVAIMGMKRLFLEVPDEPGARAFAAEVGFETVGQGVDFSFSLPVAEEDGPVAGYTWSPLEPGLLPLGDHWYTGVTAFAREGAVTGLWATPTGRFALLAEEDTLLAMVALEPQVALSTQDLLALSHHFLWVQAKNWPPDHPLLALIPPQAAPRWRRNLAARKV